MSGSLLVSGFLAFGQGNGKLSPQSNAALPSVESQRAVVNQYCVGCHNDKVKSGGFSWTEVDLAKPEQNADRAEKVIRKLRIGMMPPPGAPRPESATLQTLA